jgi:serine/threonine-protein kinase
MSPDAITNDKIDGRTDLYSLGVMLFEMLTGKLPLTSPTAQGFIGQHLICPPSTLAEACPDRTWPDEFEALLASMLAKGRKKRPASCTAILEQLDGGLRDVICGTSAAPGAASTIADLDEDTSSRGVVGLLGRLVGDS